MERMKPMFQVRWGIAGAILFTAILYVTLLLEDALFPDVFYGSFLTTFGLLYSAILSAPAAFLGLVSGGMLAGFWRNTGANQTESRRFQIGLVTMIGLMVTAGLLLWVNFIPQTDPGSKEQAAHIAYGIPFPFLFIGHLEEWSAFYKFKFGGIRLSAVAMDLMCWTFLLVLVAFLVERFLARPQRG